MCFSAGASFAASGGLGLIGGASLKTASKSHKILALFPFIFSFQQFFEGIQWVYIAHGTTSLWAAYAFLFFAYPFWPAYVPTAIYFFDRKRRHTLLWPMIIGIATSLYFLYMLLVQKVHIEVVGHSIAYDLNIPYADLAVAGYLVSVFMPLLSAEEKFLRWFGIINIVLALIAEITHHVTFASVWCFFAAVSSAIFYLYLLYTKKAQK